MDGGGKDRPGRGQQVPLHNAGGEGGHHVLGAHPQLGERPRDVGQRLRRHRCQGARGGPLMGGFGLELCGKVGTSACARVMGPAAAPAPPKMAADGQKKSIQNCAAGTKTKNEQKK